MFQNSATERTTRGPLPQEKPVKLGEVSQTCNPSTREGRQEDVQCQASLDYTVKPCLKGKGKKENKRGSC